MWPGVGTGDWGVRQKILEEAHKSKFSIYPWATKMYRDMRLSYWWTCMKRETAWLMERCLNCRKFKAEHQWPHGNVQLLRIPLWKWEEICMDFITKLPRITRGVDAIWVM